MLKKYIKKRQYKKIVSYIESRISFIQNSIDNISDENVNELNAIKERRIAQKEILKDVLHFIKCQEEES